MAKKKTKTIETEPVNYWNILYWTFIFVLAAGISIGHSIYLYTLFENDRFFSHLSDLEREMSYRTEMGLYFSYYKRIVNAPSFLDGLKSIMYDDRIEAGHTINALQRFNLYPEVYLGGFYRIFKGLTKTFGWNNEVCYQINRGKLPPVNSCEGIGNLHFFYTYCVFGLAGTVLGSVFVLGTILSNTFLGGIISAAAYMYNHGHATRVQWTPPLRESFGFPVFFFQLALLTFLLKSKNEAKLGLFLFGFATLHFILFWQFSGFALFTQITCLFVTFSLKLIDRKLVSKLWNVYILALFVSYILLFGNSLTLNSLFFTGLIAFKLISLIDTKINLSGISRVVVYTLLYLMFTGGLKFAIGKSLGIQDDDHIFDILKSKFTDFATFHTMLYTCAAEFDFIPLETLVELSETYLTVLALLGLLLVVLFVFKNVLIMQKEDSQDQAHVVFNAGQLVLFMFMAWLLMRLKLFAVPQLCVFTSILVNSNFFNSTLGFKLRWKSVIFVLIIALMTYKGKENIAKQLSVKGEYSNEAQEYLFNWIEENTHPDDVFAGSMPTMANVELSTGRKVFNHPHYEDAGLRERTLQVYLFYGRKNPNEIHKNWKKLGIKYFIFEPFLCRGHKRPECTYLGIFDRVLKEDLGKPSNCDRFLPLVESNSGMDGFKPFTLVYNSPNYVVLGI
ncbi:unnamed protein product [Bursaphelenchus xylophilus]|uniref:(pine wood nematode) hypothetical protein n=1 Tax=Bursaphelenchus xylophilus TaxID=6326 RepID=A0A1I7SR42_BURXY|nr:unnamed protein product [Bursaphelenchus xylophilus]CAG9110803.1 unnamed protein product [Bursaphelenchus xylophilus]